MFKYVCPIVGVVLVALFYQPPYLLTVPMIQCLVSTDPGFASMKANLGICSPQIYLAPITVVAVLGFLGGWIVDRVINSNKYQSSVNQVQIIRPPHDVNVKSTFSDSAQAAEDALKTDVVVKDDLRHLIANLNDELQKVPAQYILDAEAVTEMTKQVVKYSTNENLNNTMLQISAEGLKRAAQNLASVLPSVPLIVSQIVDYIDKSQRQGAVVKENINKSKMAKVQNTKIKIYKRLSAPKNPAPISEVQDLNNHSKYVIGTHVEHMMSINCPWCDQEYEIGAIDDNFMFNCVKCNNCTLITRD